MVGDCDGRGSLLWRTPEVLDEALLWQASAAHSQLWSTPDASSQPVHTFACLYFVEGSTLLISLLFSIFDRFLFRDRIHDYITTARLENIDILRWDDISCCLCTQTISHDSRRKLERPNLMQG